MAAFAFVGQQHHGDQWVQPALCLEQRHAPAPGRPGWQAPAVAAAWQQRLCVSGCRAGRLHPLKLAGSSRAGVLLLSTRCLGFENPFCTYVWPAGQQGESNGDRASNKIDRQQRRQTGGRPSAASCPAAAPACHGTSWWHAWRRKRCMARSGGAGRSGMGHASKWNNSPALSACLRAGRDTSFTRGFSAACSAQVGTHLHHGRLQRTAHSPPAACSQPAARSPPGSPPAAPPAARSPAGRSPGSHPASRCRL